MRVIMNAKLKRRKKHIHWDDNVPVEMATNGLFLYCVITDK